MMKMRLVASREPLKSSFLLSLYIRVTQETEIKQPIRVIFLMACRVTQECGL